MAKLVKMKWNLKAFREIRNAEGTQEFCLEQANKILAGCGEEKGYIADVQKGKARCHALVKTTNEHSRRDNAKHNTLIKSLGGVQ